MLLLFDISESRININIFNKIKINIDIKIAENFILLAIKFKMNFLRGDVVKFINIRKVFINLTTSPMTMSPVTITTIV
jgi:hypothetical protein